MPDVQIRNGSLVFDDPEAIDEIEYTLSRRYTRGLYIQDQYQASNERIAIELGVAFPKDVSDRRARDNVMKHINVGDVETFYAEPTGEGFYKVELPDRRELHSEFLNRRHEIANKLDYSMAKAIYSDVYQLDPVKNQLNSLIQIVRWTRRESELSVERLKDIQRSSNTEGYIQVLADLNFLRVEDGIIHPGERAEAADIQDLDIDEYEKAVVGTVIEEAYHTLRDRLDLRMLNHFPKYANSYYYSAVQRREPDLWLDTTALRNNLRQEWGDDIDPLVLDDKLRKLEEVEVIERDGDYVTGNDEIYEEVAADATTQAIAD